MSVKAPLGNIFITGCNLDVSSDNGVETYFLNPVRSEINARAVRRPICEPGRVFEPARFRPVVPLSARTSASLLISLVKHAIALGQHVRSRLIDTHLIRPQSISPDPH